MALIGLELHMIMWSICWLAI